MPKYKICYSFERFCSTVVEGVDFETALSNFKIDATEMDVLEAQSNLDEEFGPVIRKIEEILD